MLLSCSPIMRGTEKRTGRGGGGFVRWPCRPYLLFAGLARLPASFTLVRVFLRVVVPPPLPPHDGVGGGRGASEMDWNERLAAGFVVVFVVAFH